MLRYREYRGRGGKYFDYDDEDDDDGDDDDYGGEEDNYFCDDDDVCAQSDERDQILERRLVVSQVELLSHLNSI